MTMYSIHKVPAIRGIHRIRSLECGEFHTQSLTLLKHRGLNDESSGCVFVIGLVLDSLIRLWKCARPWRASCGAAEQCTRGHVVGKDRETTMRGDGGRATAHLINVSDCVCVSDSAVGGWDRGWWSWMCADGGSSCRAWCTRNCLFVASFRTA
jgi:hypothetical protein